MQLKLTVLEFAPILLIFKRPFQEDEIITFNLTLPLTRSSAIEQCKQNKFLICYHKARFPPSRLRIISYQETVYRFYVGDEADDERQNDWAAQILFCKSGD